MLKKAKAESQAYWDAVSAKITSITNEHAELRQLFSQIRTTMTIWRPAAWG